jgi:cyanophycinase-like exopeptidase
VTAAPSLPRIVTIMGSGETSPTMVSVHRDLFTRLEPGPVPAVLLDTPFGFQENADEIAARAVEYFRKSVAREVAVAGFRSTSELGTLAFETTMTRLRQASLAFAGPGSPSYALAQWKGTPVRELLADKIAHGGAITFASAAALTLGRFTVPVYEIYKVGAPPHWLEGLDLLSLIGLSVAVIPHFDNAEGGTHDTRYCYLGERRLRMMEAALPEDAFVLGVDEHTGCVLDLDADIATVVGLGRVTVRRRGETTELASGTSVPINLLRAGTERSLGAVRSSGQGPQPDAADSVAENQSRRPSLASEARRLEAVFAAAVARRDHAAAVAAILDLEGAIIEWSRDTLQSDHADRARATLRSMVVRLGEAAREGLRDPKEVVGPFVEALLALRRRARAERRFDLADEARTLLVSAGVEVRDTPGGTEWLLPEHGRS